VTNIRPTGQQKIAQTKEKELPKQDASSTVSSDKMMELALINNNQKSIEYDSRLHRMVSIKNSNEIS
jgi:hypothetical protein